MKYEMSTMLIFIFGLLLRIGIPVGITALVFLLLRRLDERWQKDAQASLTVIFSQQPCWKEKGCTEEKRKNCPAAVESATPCWQVFRTKNGLREECLGCAVFRSAPAASASQ
jgi:hypothetical protein